MLFGSIKEINRLLKEINRLLSKGMSNIYLKLTIEKKLRTQNFDFLSLKSSPPGQFLGAPTHADIIEFGNLRISGQGSKLCVAFLLFLL